MALFCVTRNINVQRRVLSTLWKARWFSYSSFNKEVQLNLRSDAQTIYKEALSAVSPQEMVKTNLLFHKNALSINNREYSVDKNVSVVAFGKAVLGMCKAVEDILKGRIIRGVASIPVGLPDAIKVLTYWVVPEKIHLTHKRCFWFETVPLCKFHVASYIYPLLKNFDTILLSSSSSSSSSLLFIHEV